ncbi:MAG: DUF2281 domain-containing protein [Haliscomenobacteraceae bacterium CHB4]|nr:hypothetical protein [Saprospiraceae bacterium]MCE7924907.1 DUF2281 domain-containing protein [Haliscomenobacteraceae bacterium CHB4]
MANLSYQINERIAILPPEMQVEVLHFIEFLLAKKNETIKTPPTKPVFKFIGKGDSNGVVNQIVNLRDFAYDD